MSNSEIKGIAVQTTKDMDQKAVVVSGEASESDEDIENIVTGNVRNTNVHIHNTCGTIISGEAPESDDDGMSLSSVSVAIEAVSCTPYMDLKPSKPKKSSVKYNSLLHKKLYERNGALARDISELCEQTITNGINQLSSANGNLLKSELILQEATHHLKNVSSRTKETFDALDQVVGAGFFCHLKA